MTVPVAQPYITTERTVMYLGNYIMSRTLSALLFFLSLLCLTPLSHAAGPVFSDGFEDGTTNKWSQDDYRNKCTVVTSALDVGAGPHGGTKMARGNWNGVVAWNDPAAYESLKLGSWSYTSDFLIRLWVRADSDVDHKFGSKWLRLYSSGAVNSLIVDGQMEQGSGSTLGPVYSNLEVVDGVVTNYNKYGSGGLGNGSWHKVEIYIHQGASAIFRLWVDGVLQHEKTGFSSSISNKWYPMYLMSNWSNNGPLWAHDANNHIYWDDIEVFSDNGTGATGLMSDGTITAGGGGGTVPNPPSSLTVTVP